MKISLIVLSISILIAACSSPKYAYYFDHYYIKAKTSTLKSENAIQMGEAFLEASTSNEILYPVTRMPMAAKASVTSHLITKNQISSVFTSSARKSGMASARSTATDDNDSKSKDGFAVAGLTLALLWPFLTYVLATGIPGPIPFVVGGILFLASMVFLSIGLKSEKQKLAGVSRTVLIIEVLLMLLGAIALSSL